MKFRIWRLIKKKEYKDVEAKSYEEAIQHYVDPREGFTVTEDGAIIGYWGEELKGD